jgi:hypothetical protein
MPIQKKKSSNANAFRLDPGASTSENYWVLIEVKPSRMVGSLTLQTFGFHRITEKVH